VFVFTKIFFTEGNGGKKCFQKLFWKKGASQETGFKEGVSKKKHFYLLFKGLWDSIPKEKRV